MKKRVFALLLALALVLGLAACDQTPQETTGTPPASGPQIPQGSQPAPDETCAHADEDQDYFCDLCQGYILVELDVFAINDLHGKVRDSEAQPGIDELTTYLKEQQGNVILLSSGDMWQGSSESNLTHGLLMTDWMNEMGFVSMTLGNHEFDWGEEYIVANAQAAQFPLLGINIYDRETQQREEFCQSSVMVERGGIQIGIIGAIGDVYSSISGDKSEGVYFKTGNELTELVEEEAQKLRTQGADVVIYSIHSGKGGVPITLSDGTVDVVFEGHSHQAYVNKDAYGIYHLQGGGENEGISHAEIFYNLVTCQVETVNAQVVYSSTYDDSAPDALIGQLLEKYAQQIALGDRIVGHNSVHRPSEYLQQLVAKLYYEKAVERWGAEYDIVLGGGMISIRNPYELEAGDVRYSQLYSLFPFDNDLVLCSIPGSSLEKNFFGNGNRSYYLYYEAYGQQVKENLDPNATYYVLVDTYTATYRANQLTEVARYDAGVYARDLLAEYLGQGGMDAPKDYTLTEISQLLSLCQQLKPGAVSLESYFVRGTVTKVENGKYGNLYIQDENGDKIYVYGVKDASGNRYDAMENPPQVGDTVILYGQLQHYVSPDGVTKYELISTTVIEE